jgi:hypothetical protein
MKKLILAMLLTFVLGCYSVAIKPQLESERFNSGTQVDIINFKVIKSDSNGIFLTICPKYSVCYNDTGTVLFESKDEYSLLRKSGTRKKIEKANLNTIDF